MAPSQPSTALHQAVSDWLRLWSDFALAQPAPSTDFVAPGDPDTPLDAPTHDPANSEPPPIAAPIGATAEPTDAPPAHWLTTIQTPTPPAHWLALLHTHGLTWDAAQGITTPEEFTTTRATVAEPSITAATHHLPTDNLAVEPAQPDASAIFREGPSARQEGLPLPSRKMPSTPPAVIGSAVNQSRAKPLAVEQMATGQAEARTPETRHKPPPEADATPPDPPSNLNPPLVEWLTRLHQGVTAVLAATSTQGNLADLPALLHTYAPVAPPPPLIDAPTPAAISQPTTPTHSPSTAIADREWTLPSAALPATTEERPTPLASAPQPVTPTPQRVTRLHLRPPETRSKDFSLSPKPQATETPSSGKVGADLPVEWPDLPGRSPGQPSHVRLTNQVESSPRNHAVQMNAPASAAPARPQPAVHIARLRVQAPGGEQAETVAAVAPATPPAPSRPLPVPVAAPKPTILPPPLPTAPLAPTEEPRLVTPPDDQSTRLARIEALLNRLLAEQGATITNTVPPSPAPVSAGVPPVRNRWPALPERSTKAERPPQRRHSDPARRRRLEEEQRGRTWNG